MASLEAATGTVSQSGWLRGQPSARDLYMPAIPGMGSNGDGPWGGEAVPIGLQGQGPSFLNLIVSTNPSTGTQCQTPKGWLRLVCEHGSIAWKPMRCRHCEGCFNWRRKATISKIMYGLEGEKWISFCTFTSMPGASWPFLMRAFQSLVKTLRKSYGRVEYVASKEEGASTGMKHLHVLLVGPSWIPYAVLSQAWLCRSGAWSVNIQRVSSGGTAAYITKGLVAYLTKAGTEWRKLITFSKGWTKTPRVKMQEVHFYLHPPEPRPWAGLLLHGGYIEVRREQCTCFGVLTDEVKMYKGRDYAVHQR